MDTALMINWFDEKKMSTGVDADALKKSMHLTDKVFI
jgi:hypothetical protein